MDQHDLQKVMPVNNDPEIVSNVTVGEVIEVRDEAISDWPYMRSGKMVGNYTLRPLLKHMPKDEPTNYGTCWRTREQVV